jgi:hypothetical protein
MAILYFAGGFINFIILLKKTKLSIMIIYVIGSERYNI